MLKGDKGWRQVLLRSVGKTLEYHLEIKRIKKIYISVKPEGVIVTAPIGVTLQEIEECLNYDAHAILRAKERMDKKVSAAVEKKKQLSEKQQLEFLGGNLPFEIVRSAHSKVELGNNGLVFYMQNVDDYNESKLQLEVAHFLKIKLRKFYRVHSRIDHPAFCSLEFF